MQYSEEKFKQLMNNFPLPEYYNEVESLLSNGQTIQSILEFAQLQVQMASNSVDSGNDLSYGGSQGAIRISAEEAQAYVDDGILFHGIAIFYAKMHNIRISLNMSKSLVNTLREKLNVEEEPLEEVPYNDRKTNPLNREAGDMFYLKGWE